MKSRYLIPMIFAGAVACAGPSAHAQEEKGEPEHLERVREREVTDERRAEAERAIAERRTHLENLRKELDSRAEEHEARLRVLHDQLEERFVHAREFEEQVEKLHAEGIGGDDERIQEARAALLRAHKSIRAQEERVHGAQQELHVLHARSVQAIEEGERALHELRARAHGNEGGAGPHERDPRRNPGRHGPGNVVERVTQLERAVHEMRAILERHGIGGERARRAMEEIEARRRVRSFGPSDEPFYAGDRRARHEFGKERPVRPDGHAVRAEIEELRIALDRSRTENSELRTKLGMIQRERHRTGGTSADPSRETGELRKHNAVLRKEMEELRHIVEDLRAELAAVREKK